MKLTILQNKLKQGLSCVEKIATKSPSLPILGNVLLSSEGNFLKLSCTNLEMGIHYWVLAKIEQEGKIPVVANVFSNFVNYLAPDSLLLEKDKSDLLVSCQNTKSRIKGLDPEDFPIIPKAEKQEKAIIKPSLLLGGLSQLVNIVSFSNIRPEISGIYFNFKKDVLTIAATDSFRLGEKKIKFQTPLEISKEYSFILPQKTASFLLSLFADQGKEVAVYFSPNLVMFEVLMEETQHPKIQFVSKLIEGEYPKYKEIIPSQHSVKAVLNKKEFLNQVKTAGLFAGRINEIKMIFDSKTNKIEILCQDPELGRHSSLISSPSIDGESLEISFNYKFLLDGIKNLEGDEIIFSLSRPGGQEGPGLLKSAQDDTYLYVVMPIQAS